MKIFLLFVFIFAIYPAFATEPDIPKNTTTASCADTVLNTNGGNVNIEINWEPNTIPIHWYDGNTELTVPTESQSCVYGGSLTPPPPPPTKEGYTFRGWKVRYRYDFSRLPTNVNGLDYRAVQTGRKYCWHYNDSNHTCTSAYNHIDQYEFEVIFDWGTVYGKSRCSSTPGSYGESGTPELVSNAKYEWCKITGYKKTYGSGIKYTPSQNMSWVFVNTTQESRDCILHSALDCAQHLFKYESFRRALFNATQ